MYGSDEHIINTNTNTKAPEHTDITNIRNGGTCIKHDHPSPSCRKR